MNINRDYLKKQDLSLIFGQKNYYESAAGLILPTSCKPEKHPIAVDFFCGIGGASLGFIQAGWNVIAAVEWDISAIFTYLINLGAYPLKMIFIEESDRERTEKYLQKYLKADKNGLVKSFSVSGENRARVCEPWFKGVQYMFVGDARKLSGYRMLEVMGLKQGDIDCIIGCPPCQGFSSLGKQDIMDTRNSLVFEWARFVVEMQPKMTMMENVPGIVDMVTPEGIPVMDAVCQILADGNFGTINTLKRSLYNSSGLGAMLKNKSKMEKKGKTNNKVSFNVRKKTKEVQEPDLFNKEAI